MLCCRALKGESMGLELYQKQKQALSQRMIQSVRILQMTSQELENYIDDIALENPVMDVEKHSEANESIDAWRASHDAGEQDHYLLQRQRSDDDYDPKDTWNYHTDHGETLRDHLLSQLDLHRFTKTELLVLDYLLDSLDERGYLTEDVSFVSDRFDTDDTTVEHLILMLQELEPAGVCAKDLPECLKIQLRRQGVLTEALEEAVDTCLTLVAKNRIPAIAAKLGVTNKEASRFCTLIRSLQPKPGSRFYHQDDVQYIIPDVYVTGPKDDLAVQLRQGDVPEIRINGYYRSLFQTSEEKEIREYLENKMRQAEWVQQCIAQRQNTMMRVSEEILHSQIDFFRNGPNHLQPLTMAQVADEIGMHESTISRAIDRKFLQCCWGVFPMAYFFQKKASARNNRAAALAEENVTPMRVKQKLREIIAAENPNKPYSDRILSEKLGEAGITISRRTVAKYREEEHIPDASGRKKY